MKQVRRTVRQTSCRTTALRPK